MITKLTKTGFRYKDTAFPGYFMKLLWLCDSSFERELNSGLNIEIEF